MLTFFLTQSTDGFSFGPVALLIIVLAAVVVGFLYRSGQDKKAAAATAVQPAATTTPATGKMVAAPGSFGEIQLHNVEDKTAAMLMAIVADEIKTPLNQLRFLSIRQLKEGK